MLTIQTGQLNEIIHKYRHGGIIRVLCKITLEDYGIIDCHCDENEFPIHFLPLLIDNYLSISTFKMYLDHLKTFPGAREKDKDKNENSLDLSKFIPTKILPFPNQPMMVHAHLFNNLQIYGKSYQSLIKWSPNGSSAISPRKEQFDQLMMLEHLYKESQINEDIDNS
jgi:hypothetical protein